MAALHNREQVVVLTGLLDQLQEYSPELQDHILLLTEQVSQHLPKAVRVDVEAVVQLVDFALRYVLAQQMALVDLVLLHSSQRTLSASFLQSRVEPLL